MSVIKKIHRKKTPSISQVAEMMHRMCKAQSSLSIMSELLNGGIKLVCPLIECRGAVFEFDRRKGCLHPILSNKEIFKEYFLNKAETQYGLIGHVMTTKDAAKVDDISNSEYAYLYENNLSDSVSEISVPIITKNLQVRIKEDVEESGTKFIGILHIETSRNNFFTEEDVNILKQLTDYAAILIENSDHASKLSRVRVVESYLAKNKNRKKSGTSYENDINYLINEIMNLFGFDLINISLVDLNKKRIQSKYVYGLIEEDTKEFKRMADHLLSENDIQSDIVRKCSIEVPETNDYRFDRRINEKFGYHKLIRVFMPIFETNSNEVFGTFEAGYDSSTCSYIYEDDIRILKSLTWNISSLMEQQRSSFVEQIIHELSSPLSAIRGHASYVQMKVATCSNNRISLKMSDIIHESDMIIHQIDKLEYLMLGRSEQTLNKLDDYKSNLFKDIVTRILFERKPALIRIGLEPNIEIIASDKIKKLKIRTNAPKLGQVIHNLMDNAIKYREEGKPSFDVKIIFKESTNYIYVFFQDWGIGVKKTYSKRIFNEGFRDPDVMSSKLGSGLGLFISKDIMIHLGGDLELTNCYNPTEFTLSIPK